MNKHIALVTGGTRGIGSAIAQQLKYADYRVVVNFQGNSTAAELFARQNDIKTYQWDISDYEACQQGVKQIEDDLGPIDILVNNAGITRDVMFHKMSFDQWQNVLTTNLTSCFNMCRSVITGMRERNYGRIVNISSINGQKGQLGQVNYAAAKSGMIGFTKALALENAIKGITVNTIAPGYIETDMMATIPREILQKIVDGIPVNRLGTPQEIARTVAFLVSENAGFITGATLSVNGGQYMI